MHPTILQITRYTLSLGFVEPQIVGSRVDGMCARGGGGSGSKPI